MPEDGDDENHPNVFQMADSSQVQLHQLKKAFPLPGVFLFRFLQTVNNTEVWLDATDDNMIINQRNICMKVTRIQNSSNNASITSRSRTNSNTNNSQPPPITTGKGSPRLAASAPGTAPQRRLSEKLIRFDEDSSSPHGNPNSNPSPAQVDSNPLFDGFGDDPFATNSSSTSNSNVTTSKANSSSDLNDVFGAFDNNTVLQPTTAVTNMNQGSMGGRQESPNPMLGASNPMMGASNPMMGGSNPMMGGMGSSMNQGRSQGLNSMGGMGQNNRNSNMNSNATNNANAFSGLGNLNKW